VNEALADYASHPCAYMTDAVEDSLLYGFLAAFLKTSLMPATCDIVAWL
jgi:hypothetical protein